MLKEIILDTLVKTAKDWQPKSHYPSSASFKYPDGSTIGPDLLSQYLKWTGVRASNPPSGESIIKMRLGDATHGMLGNVLALADIKCVSESSFKAAIQGLVNPISGRTDFLVELAQELEVIEAKSTTDSQMFGSDRFGDKFSIGRNGPKPEHKLQMISYLNNIPGVKRGRFLYIARDTGAMLEYVMERVVGKDEYLMDGKPVPYLSWAGIISRWQTLEEAVKTRVAPPPDYRAWINEKTGNVMKVKTINGATFKTDWHVMYDSYRDAIWGNPENFKFSNNVVHPNGVPSGKLMSEM